jgi:DNA-binding response OmpR family regulator
MEPAMSRRLPMRVLVVEDEMLVALMICDMLSDLGYNPVGPAMRLDQGLDLAKKEPIDAAVLDVNLGDAKSFPVADVLRDRRVPFIFATGYGIADPHEAYPGVTALSKPFSAGDLDRALKS